MPYSIRVAFTIRRSSCAQWPTLCNVPTRQELLRKHAWGKDKKAQGYRTDRYSAARRRYFWALLRNAASAASGDENLWDGRPSLAEREWRDRQGSPGQMDSQTVSRERWPVRQS